MGSPVSDVHYQNVRKRQWRRQRMQGVRYRCTPTGQEQVGEWEQPWSCFGMEKKEEC